MTRTSPRQAQLLNKIHEKKYGGQPALSDRMQSLEMAYKLQESAPDVFDE